METIIPRLKKIIEYYNLSSSSFADKINVQRSSISHLLSGRNKPSLDFIMKVVNAFPEVDLYWLLKNEGSFPKKENNKNSEVEVIEEKLTAEIKKDTPSLFSENLVFEQEPEKKSNTRFSEITKISKNSKKITRVLLFFEDGTFEAYEQ